MCIKIEDFKKFNTNGKINNFEELKESIKNTNDNFIILKGKVNAGKTTTAIKLVEYFNYNENLKTLFFSLEINEETIRERINVNSNNLIIYDRPINIEDIITKIKKLNVDVVVIDYLQLILSNNKDVLFREQRELIKEELKKLSKKLNIKILVTSICN